MFGLHQPVLSTAFYMKRLRHMYDNRLCLSAPLRSFAISFYRKLIYGMCVDSPHGAKRVKAPWQHCFPTENMLLGLMEREEGGAEAARSIWDSHCSDGI